jgi:rare lipoprotein A
MSRAVAGLPMWAAELRDQTAQTGAKMNRQGMGLLAGVVGAALVLTGCQTGTSSLASKDTGAPEASGAAQGIVTMEKDIESPDTFNITSQGLWDGRPSLGGVWVAHASVKEPERVLIRNTKNGKTVVGALFRREHENPGPSLQMSSDAAEALGMLAGQPAEISVVALRRQEVDLTPAAEVTPETEAAATAAAADTAKGIAPTDSKAAAPDKSAAPDAAAAAAVPLAGGDAAAAAPDAAMADEPAPKKRGLFGGLFKRKPKAEDTAAADAATTAPIAGTAGAGAIEQAPLDPVLGTAAAGIAAAEAKQATPAPAPSPELKRAYLQIGIFSTEANAAKAAAQLKKAGMIATIAPSQSNGKPYWRVIVGPVTSVAERDAFAAKVKGLGYPDAYPVSK